MAQENHRKFAKEMRRMKPTPLVGRFIVIISTHHTDLAPLLNKKHFFFFFFFSSPFFLYKACNTVRSSIFFLLLLCAVCRMMNQPQNNYTAYLPTSFFLSPISANAPSHICVCKMSLLPSVHSARYDLYRFIRRIGMTIEH